MSRVVNRTLLCQCLCLVLCAAYGMPPDERGSTRIQILRRLWNHEKRVSSDGTRESYDKADNGPEELQGSFATKLSKVLKEKESMEQTKCDDMEWFVLVANRPACIDPLWHIGYDPTFCNKMKNGWVLCRCGEDKTQGIAEAIKTCLDKKRANQERCYLTPCPQPFKCKDTKPGVRFDCIHEDVIVPTYYSQKEGDDWET